MNWKKKKLLHALKSSVALVWCDDQVARVFMFYQY